MKDIEIGPIRPPSESNSLLIREKAYNIGRNINREGIRYAVQKTETGVVELAEPHGEPEQGCLRQRNARLLPRRPGKP